MSTESIDAAPIRLNVMWGEAERLVADHGLESDSVDIPTVILATTPAKVVERVASDTQIARIYHGTDLHTRELDKTYRGLVDPEGDARMAERTAYLDAANERARDLYTGADRLGRGARRRNRLAMFAAGSVLGMMAFGWLGAASYDVEVGPHVVSKGGNPHLIKKPMLAHNVMTWDSSILPANHGKHLPVIGSILRVIPGVPDFGDFTENTVYNKHVKVGEKHVVLRGGYKATEVRNPVAHDLQLTGVEYQQGIQAAKEVLTGAKHKDFKIKEVTVTGFASDDFGGELGKLNMPQARVAELRGAVAAKALKHESHVLGVKLPDNLAVSGHEVVLDKAQIGKVKQAAHKEHMTQAEVLAAYDSNKHLSKHTRRLLNRLLKRGSRIELTGEEPIIKTVPKTKTVRKHGSKTFAGDLSGEGAVGFGGVLGLVIGDLGLSMYAHNSRSIRRKAKKQLRKAGLDLS